MFIRLKFWPIPKPLRKIIFFEESNPENLLSNGGFCTKFGPKTARISSSETRGFYTFSVVFELGVFTDFTKEKGRIKHFAADFIFWIRVKKRVNYGTPLRQVKNQAQEHRYLSLILGSFVYLPSIVRLEGVAHLETKHRKKEGFFFSPEVLIFTAEHRQQSL